MFSKIFKHVTSLCSIGILIFALCLGGCGFESVADHDSKVAKQMSDIAIESTTMAVSSKSNAKESSQKATSKESSQKTESSTEKKENDKSSNHETTQKVTTSNSKKISSSKQTQKNQTTTKATTSKQGAVSTQTTRNSSSEKKTTEKQTTKKQTTTAKPTETTIASISVSISINAEAAGEGMLLSTKTYHLKPGSSAYQLLFYACSQNGVSMSSETTQYGIYVNGIGGIFEKDHGPMGGWLYYVNGGFPSTSCGNYILKDGDSVSFTYTK